VENRSSTLIQRCATTPRPRGQRDWIPMQATVGGTLKRQVIETTGLGANPGGLD